MALVVEGALLALWQLRTRQPVERLSIHPEAILFPEFLF